MKEKKELVNIEGWIEYREGGGCGHGSSVVGEQLRCPGQVSLAQRWSQIDSRRRMINWGV